MSITFFLGVAQTSESTQILGLECMGGLNKMSWGGGVQISRETIYFASPSLEINLVGGRAKTFFGRVKRFLGVGG